MVCLSGTGDILMYTFVTEVTFWTDVSLLKHLPSQVYGAECIFHHFLAQVEKWVCLLQKYPLHAVDERHINNIPYIECKQHVEYTAADMFQPLFEEYLVSTYNNYERLLSS